MYKSGIWDTKTSNMSQVKQSRAKVITKCLQTLVYDLSIGNISGDLGWTLTYFFKEQNFPQGTSCTLFVGAQRYLTALWVWPIETYSLNFVNLSPGGPVISCGDIHQSFTDTLVTWFLDTFPCLPIVLDLFLITAIARGLAVSFLYKCPASRGSSLRQHGLLVTFLGSIIFLQRVKLGTYK